MRKLVRIFVVCRETNENIFEHFAVTTVAVVTYNWIHMLSLLLSLCLVFLLSVHEAIARDDAAVRGGGGGWCLH